MLRITVRYRIIEDGCDGNFRAIIGKKRNGLIPETFERACGKGYVRVQRRHMISKRDLTELPLFGIAIDSFTAFGNAVPHEDIGGFYPLLKMVASRKRVYRHTGIERDEKFDIRMVIDDP